MKDYVILTAARNEGSYIEHTLKSVVAQTHLPLRWIIVSDGSTDNTVALVQKYAEQYDFIELIERHQEETRSFGSKARAINTAYRRVAALSHCFVAVLDADISFESDYYARLLVEFEKDPQLGLSGGFVLDIIDKEAIRRQLSVNWSVRGPVQTFRRECFEDIGGYRVLKYGGIDAVAELMSRKAGWKVRTVPELYAKHLRATGTETQNFIKAHFKVGKQNYVNGYWSVFMFLRCLKRLPQTPVIMGATAMLAGYFAAWIAREPYAIPTELIKFLRNEQKRRLLKS